MVRSKPSTVRHVRKTGVTTSVLDTGIDRVVFANKQAAIAASGSVIRARSESAGSALGFYTGKLASGFVTVQPAPRTAAASEAGPTIFVSPGGETLVVLPIAEYERLVSAASINADEHEDARLADEGLRSLEDEGAIPADVARAILMGAHPVAAWRTYHGLSQAQLADRVGITQAAIARIEKAPPGAGRPMTRRRIAEALGAPIWSIEDS